MDNDFLNKVYKSGYNGANARELSPLVLAYVGDAVFEILVRTRVISEGNAPVNKLHKKSKDYVNAKSQAEMIFRLEEFLTDEEKAVYKRGRNAKSFTSPKNGDIIDYRNATGLEALFGYLYLKGEMDRVVELFNKGVEG